MKTFGDYLKELRTLKGYSTNDVQYLTGIHKSSISKYEIGRFNPPIHNLVLLANTYDVNEKELCDDFLLMVHGVG